MLLAVEGGGFFTASASGYSKFLSLLIFGQKNEERPMKVSPWSHYHLVEHKVDTCTKQLAPKKNISSSGSSSCFCFGRPSTCHDGNLPPKVGPLSQSDSPSGPSASEERNGSTTCGGTEENGGKTFIKSIIKKSCPVATGNVDKLEKADERDTVVTKNGGDRKVQWTDACGKELVEIREFQPSEEGTLDEDGDRSGFRKCECVIQ